MSSRRKRRRRMRKKRITMDCWVGCCLWTNTFDGSVSCIRFCIFLRIYDRVLLGALDIADGQEVSVSVGRDENCDYVLGQIPEGEESDNGPDKDKFLSLYSKKQFHIIKVGGRRMFSKGMLALFASAVRYFQHCTGTLIDWLIAFCWHFCWSFGWSIDWSIDLWIYDYSEYSLRICYTALLLCRKEVWFSFAMTAPTALSCRGRKLVRHYPVSVAVEPICKIGSFVHCLPEYHFVIIQTD